MKSFRTFSKRFPLLVALIMLVYIWCGVQYIPYPMDNDLGWAIVEFLLMVVCAALTVLFLGPALFRPRSAGWGYALRKSRYYLIVNVGVLGLLALVVTVASSLAAGATVEFCKTFLLALVLAVCIGILEELVFHVFLFGGLLAKMGSSHAGLLGAAAISSLIFGFIHVVSGLFDGTEFSGLYILQVVGKTLQTGMMGFLMCAVYVKTRNFWCIASLHALSDFFGLWMSFMTSTATGAYASGGSNMVILYFLTILLNIPVLVTSVKMLRSAPLPQEGPLVDDAYLPCAPADQR